MSVFLLCYGHTLGFQADHKMMVHTVKQHSSCICHSFGKGPWHNLQYNTSSKYILPFLLSNLNFEIISEKLHVEILIINWKKYLHNE